MNRKRITWAAGTAVVFAALFVGLGLLLGGGLSPIFWALIGAIAGAMSGWAIAMTVESEARAKRAQSSVDSAS